MKTGRTENRLLWFILLLFAATAHGQVPRINNEVPSGPAISRTTVYFGSYDGFLYAVSLDGQ